MQRLTGRSHYALPASGKEVTSAVRRTIGRQWESNTPLILSAAVALGFAAGIYYFFPEMRRYLKMYRM
jgi:hypothetical protein